MRSLALVVWLVCVVSLVCGQSVPPLRESPLLKGSVINDAERQPTAIPGTQFTHWAFPTEAQIDYLQSRGATLVRVPINIGRLLPTLDGQLDATQVNAIENLLRYTASRSLNVIIAPHGNGDAQMYDSVSATYKKIGSGSDQISSATFARFWGLLAARFRKFPTVMFALLETPTSPTPAAWASIAQDAVNAIRATGATQRIFVSGTASSWANAWVSSGNGAALAGLQDSANNLMYDVRIFLGSTGTSQTSTCASSMGGATAIGASTTWAVQQGKRMLLTLKWANNANCQSVASSLFSYMRSNANAWVGYAYGEMGLSYWHSSTTAYNIQPADFKEGTAVPVQVDTMLYDWQQSGLMPFVPTPYTPGQKWKGVNMAGFETNRGNPNGVLNTDFIAPTEREIAYFAAAGMNIVRFPLAGARLQPVLYQPLNNNNLNLIKSTLALCQQYNMQLLLDPHDYGSMYDSVRGGGGLINVAGGVEISAFTDFWTRVATAFLSYPATAVSFGLMNEPNEQNAWQWRDAAVAAMAAIRATGATNKIFIPGTSYTGGHNWVDVGNAAAWTGITDPANNFVFEIHQYLDQYYSGVNSNCPTNGARILADATSWARRNGYQLFVGEVGWSTSSDCTTQGQAILDFMHANADVFLGYAYWASGRWWSADYAFSVQPAGVNTAGATPTDKVQMAALRADVARTPPPQV